ncbi:hypothetical protein AB0P17_06440 [Streptomyces sp. NPDC088124]|uniref:hypothetical protein n=1 Tax=Streptomyces sp. NPDC088124 TaxID=3154654 RepID=UPI00342AE4F5
MTLWLKARRAHTVLPFSLLLFTVFAVLVRDVVVVLPSIAGSHQVVLSLFVPIPLVAGMALCLESRVAAAEASAVRTVARLDAGLVLATMAAAVSISLLIRQVTQAPQVDITGRNTVFLTGLMLCGRIISRQRAVLIPTVWPIVVVLVGFRPTGDAYPWTIIPEPAGAPHATIAAALFMCTGILAQLYTSRKIS